MFPRPFFVLSALLLVAAPARAASVSVTEVRSWSGPDSTRVVLDLSDESVYSVERTASPPELLVTIRDARADAPSREWDQVDQRIRSVSLEQGEGEARVRIRLADFSPYKHFSLKPYGDSKPHRIVVDVLPGRSESRSEQQLTRAPEPEPAPVLAQDSGRPFLVVIDAGHGGEDPGALGRYYKTREKDVVLAIARNLKRQLDAMPGIRAELTRNGDYFISLGSRVRKADRLRGDLFVSIHADSSGSRRTRGTHIYTLAPRTSRDRRAIRVAHMENASDQVGGVEDAARLPVVFDGDGSPNDMVESRVLASLAMERLSLVNRGDREGRASEARFWVLKGQRPSILVETGFLSNREDERQLRDPDFQKRLAYHLALAVRDYRDSRVGGVPRQHVVRNGENLDLIARRYGVEVRDIAAENKLRDPSRLLVGQTLLIPGRVSEPAPVTRALARAARERETSSATPVSLPRNAEAAGGQVHPHTVRRGENATTIARDNGIRVADLLRANRLTTHSSLHVGQRLVIPPARNTDGQHVVQRGDTLTRVAESYGISLSELARVNDLRRNSRLYAGRTLIIPGAGAAAPYQTYSVGKGDTLSELALRFGIPLSRLAKMNGLSTRERLEIGQKLKVPQRDGDGQRIHVVRRGDSLSRIARLYAVPVERLLSSNGLRNADQLLVGERLLIPD
ncbi:MAG: LysM peptidoglycan-binding domain-containing protein [Nitrospirota bacterium]|nr:LysM peptidoglycan-binding domain-containing protein [Nitrospirota bacterium]